MIQLKQSINKNEKFIEIPKILLESLNNLKSFNKKETEVEIFIKNIIENSNNRGDITCRKLSKMYCDSTGKYISKSSVNTIIRKRLGYKFLKTTYKNNFLKSENGIILCLCFIKVFTRLLKLGFEIIFLDESKIELYNSHLKCWRKQNETIYFSNNHRRKINLVMAIGKNKIYKYKLNKDNTNEKLYLDFLNELCMEFQKEPEKKFVIILDNLRTHKTKKVFSYCEEKKINLLFNVPYQSTFNCIELCFRAIKKIIYSKLFIDIEEVTKKIDDIINSEHFNDTLLFNYQETLQEYLFYAKKHKFENINRFKIKQS